MNPFTKYLKVVEELDDYFGMDTNESVVEDHTEEYFNRLRGECVRWADTKEELFELEGYSATLISYNTSQDGKYHIFYCRHEDGGGDGMLVFLSKNEVTDQEWDEWENSNKSDV